MLALISLAGAGAALSPAQAVSVLDLGRADAVATVRTWMLAGTAAHDGALKPAVAALVADELHRVRARLAATPAPTAAPAAAGETADSLAGAIAAWAHGAHAELQAAAWPLVAWWKLLWRVDDVGVHGRSLLAARFLPRSEAAATFLAGRLHGAGFRAPPMNRRTSTGDVVTELDTLAQPAAIAAQRANIAETLVPGLQRSAQKYLLASLSTSGLSAALSTLLYLSDVPLYSALTVAAVGTVGSARMLQSRWMRDQARFTDEVTERGREAIVESERWAWERLRIGMAPEVDEELEREWAKSQKLLSVVDEGLQVLQEKKLTSVVDEQLHVLQAK